MRERGKQSCLTTIPTYITCNRGGAYNTQLFFSRRVQRMQTNTSSKRSKTRSLKGLSARRSSEGARGDEGLTPGRERVSQVAARGVRPWGDVKPPPQLGRLGDGAWHGLSTRQPSRGDEDTTPGREPVSLVAARGARPRSDIKSTPQQGRLGERTQSSGLNRRQAQQQRRLRGALQVPTALQTMRQASRERKSERTSTLETSEVCTKHND